MIRFTRKINKGWKNPVGCIARAIHNSGSKAPNVRYFEKNGCLLRGINYHAVLIDDFPAYPMLSCISAIEMVAVNGPKDTFAIQPAEIVIIWGYSDPKVH
ncbi:hypothetical protein BB778_25185 [Pluralibacter gergoviae]|nr:hypothetical protein BB778_25185 [Pluralibacter gergoviae]